MCSGMAVPYRLVLCSGLHALKAGDFSQPSHLHYVDQALSKT